MTRLTFGVDRDPGVVAEWQGRRGLTTPLSKRPNPMLVAYGPGPEGRSCGECVNLVHKGGTGSHRYFGCLQRGPLNNGPSTDHLAGWAACRQFTERS